MQEVSYYRFTYRKGKIVRLLAVYSFLLLLINGILFSSDISLLRYILILMPFVILFSVNLIKYIKSINVEYLLHDGFLIIRNKRKGFIKEVPITDIQLINRYFTYTRYSDRSYAYSKLIKVFLTNETIEVYDTIQNNNGMILPEVLEKDFEIEIRYVHDGKIIILMILDFLLSMVLT